MLEIDSNKEIKPISSDVKACVLKIVTKKPIPTPA
jgi:hypothetical protein